MWQNIIQVHYLRGDFNTKLKAVRTKKLSLQRELQVFSDELDKIRLEIPEKKIKHLLSVFTFNYDVEFPENYLEVRFSPYQFLIRIELSFKYIGVK